MAEEDKIEIQPISFNIFADSKEEADELKKSIVEFIDWFRMRGVKVTAKKASDAIKRWDKNLIVRNNIIKYMYDGKQ